MIEISYGTGKRVRIVKIGDALYVQKKVATHSTSDTWSNLARIDGPTAWIDAHRELARYNIEATAAQALQEQQRRYYATGKQ